LQLTVVPEAVIDQADDTMLVVPSRDVAAARERQTAAQS